MKFVSLFAGIGGFDIGLERAGMQCVGQVEIDPFCQAVLAHHWPHVRRVDDIRKVVGDEFGTVDLVCGGFPCQPFSLAGKRAGAKDDRYLWPEMLRVIQALRPAWVLGENVAGIIGVELDKVLASLEGIGYSVQRFIIPACAVDAPHRRDGVWIVGYADQSRQQAQRPCSIGSGSCNEALLSGAALAHAEIGAERTGLCAGKPGRIGRGRFGDGSGQDDVADAAVMRMEGVGQSRICQPSGLVEEIILDGSCQGSRTAQWELEPDVGRLADGVPNRVAQLRALGNAVVPQVVEEIGRAIMQAEGRPHVLCSGAAAEHCGSLPYCT